VVNWHYGNRQEERIMSNVAMPPGEIVVDSRGRTNLQRVRTGNYSRYTAVEHEDGTLVLTPAVTVTPAELAELRAAAQKRRRNRKQEAEEAEEAAQWMAREGGQH